MRGTHQISSSSSCVVRFIPAGAGNTRSPPDHEKGVPVHPRGCGEHPAACLTMRCNVGSSPRVRGTPPPPRFPAVLSRFIPAGAGNTQSMCGSIERPPVHPRGCGEHNALRSSESCIDGSSPRVRGTRSNRFVEIYLGRFIPAGAGNTAAIDVRTSGGTVHPRGCGEHSRVPAESV